jgi:hypothetical protein
LNIKLLERVSEVENPVLKVTLVLNEVRIQKGKSAQHLSPKAAALKQTPNFPRAH